MYLFELWFSPHIRPQVGLLDHMVALFFSFLRQLHTVLHGDHFILPPTVWEGSLSSTPSQAFVVCRLFDYSLSDRREVIPHCDFDLRFSNRYSAADF